MARATTQLASIPDCQHPRLTAKLVHAALRPTQRAEGLPGWWHSHKARQRNGGGWRTPCRQHKANTSPLLPPSWGASASTDMVLALAQSSSHKGVAVGHEHALQHTARPNTLQQQCTGGVEAAQQQRGKGGVRAAALHKQCRGSMAAALHRTCQGTSITQQQQRCTGHVRASAVHRKCAGSSVTQAV